MFNPHNNRTANGVLITDGLVVFTNELTVGKVIADQNDSEFGCCQPTALAGREAEPGDLTEEVDSHMALSGQMRLTTGYFTNHQFENPTCPSPYNCRHNHWFRVATKDGTKAFDGERLATIFEGKRAADEWASEYN